MQIEKHELPQLEKAEWKVPELKEFNVAGLTQNLTNPGGDTATTLRS